MGEIGNFLLTSFSEFAKGLFKSLILKFWEIWVGVQFKMLGENMDIKTVVDSMVETLKIFPDNILAKATSQVGFEKMIYPYFNLIITKQIGFEELKGIGSGQVDIFGREEVDCLIITNSDEKIAIEIKGPSQKSYLLKGANGNFGNEEIEKCLKEKLSISNQNQIHPDSHIGDVHKIIKLINQFRIAYGYCVGLLIYTDSSQNEVQQYMNSLIESLSCFSDQHKHISIKYESRLVMDRSIFLSVIEVKNIS